MFFKLLSSARSILNPTVELPAQTVSNYSEMVTTRGQVAAAAENYSEDREDAVFKLAGSSSRKRARSSRNDSTRPTAAADKISPSKRRKLPVRAKNDDESAEVHTHVAVEIPMNKLPQGWPGKISTPKPAKNKRVVIDSRESEVEEKKSISPQEGQTASLSQTTSEITSKSRTSGDGEAFDGTRFSSPDYEDPSSVESQPIVELLTRQEDVLQAAEVDENSDDDAPEEVITQDAEKTAKKGLREAAKGLEEQESATRKKRKERDALLKQQAKGDSKKREQDDSIDRTSDPARTALLLAQALTSSEKRIASASDSIQEAIETAATPVAEEAGLGKGIKSGGRKSLALLTAVTGKSTKNAASLPNLLPQDYLEDRAISDSDDEGHKVEPPRLSKKMKFQDSVLDKAPKDLKKGATTYRVASTTNTLLTPKAVLQARKTKEMWMQGRAVKTGSNNRRPFSTGFFIA